MGTTTDTYGATTTSTRGLSRSIVATAAQMAISERPKVTSPFVGGLLFFLMVVGLVAFVAGIAVLAVYGAAHLLLQIAERNPGSFPSWLLDQTSVMIPQLRGVLLYCMIGSALYGLASFLWFKFETHRWFGTTLSYLLFLIVPALLLAAKHFEPQLVVWMSLESGHLPDPLLAVARYYSLGWYALLVLLAVVRYRSEANERMSRAFTRFWLLALLCYLPYGYVLFVGESAFLGSIFTNYVGDIQLILWALMPLRR